MLAPRVLSQPDPEYTDEARQSKYQGVLLLGATVTNEGTVSDLCVLQELGRGPDEVAMNAVKLWRFQPALESATPVPARISVEVSFMLY